MMKRFLSLFLAALMVLSLCACGKKDSADVDLSAFYETLFTEGDAPMMMELDEDLLDTFYPGLTEIPRLQTVAYAAAISSIPAEVVLVEVEHADDAGKVEEILQARVSYQVDDLGAWYPETIEGWKNHSEIVSIGNYVALFVADSEDAMAESFRTLF